MSSTIHKKKILAVAISLGGLFADASANAQGAGATSAKKEINALEEVVVTARKQEEFTQSAPVSLTTFTTEALQEKSVKELKDLTALTPGLRVVTTGGGNNADTSMRGLNATQGGDASIAVVSYFAEVPLQFDAGLPSTYDLANIQVLKGPQGTLFGRNTIGGAILMYPQAPNYEFGGYLKGAYGNFNYKLLEGAVNIPIIDNKVALRLAGQVNRRDGYVKNEGVGDDLNNTHQNNYRISLLFTPTEKLENTTVLDHRNIIETGSAGILVDVSGSGLASYSSSTPFLGPFFANLDPLWHCGTSPDCDVDLALQRQKNWGPYKTKTNVAPKANANIYTLANTTEYDLGGAKIRNLFGYGYVLSTTVIDADGLPFDPPIVTAQAASRSIQTSDELQLVGTSFNDTLDWIVGGFALQNKWDQPSGFAIPAISFVPFPSITPTDEANAQWTAPHRDNRNYGLFGQIGYDLSQWVDGLKVDLGARKNWDEKFVCTETFANPGEPQNPVGGSCDNKERYSGNAWTWTFGIDYQLNPDTFLYATTRRGYREGGMNSQLDPVTQAILIPYQKIDPEKLSDLELGIKSDWTIGAILGRFNLAVYKEWFSNVQLTQSTAGLPLAVQPPGGSIGVNGGDKEFSGFESELTIRPTSNLTLSWLGAYLHVDKANLTLPAALNPLGTPQIPVTTATPEWTSTVAMRYVLPFHPLSSDLVFNADYYYSGSVTIADYTLPSYNVVNARLDWQNIAGSNVDLALFGKNLGDKEYIAAAGSVNAALGLTTAQYGAPRTAGIEASYKF